MPGSESIREDDWRLLQRSTEKFGLGSGTLTPMWAALVAGQFREVQLAPQFRPEVGEPLGAWGRQEQAHAYE